MISKSCTCAVGRLETVDATDISELEESGVSRVSLKFSLSCFDCCVMSIRRRLLLTIFIYPAIRPGDRLGLQRQPVPRLQDDVCFLGYPPAFAAVPQYFVHTLGVLHPTMPAADCRYALGSPYGSLSPIRDTQRLSRGNPGDFRCTTVGYTQLRTTTDRGLYCVLPARPIAAKPNPLAVRQPAPLPSASFRPTLLLDRCLRLRWGWLETLV